MITDRLSLGNNCSGNFRRVIPVVKWRAMNAKQNRLKNLRALIDSRFDGVAGRCADAVGVKRPQMSRWVTENSEVRQGIAEDSARQIEAKLGIERGSLDQDVVLLSSYLHDDVAVTSSLPQTKEQREEIRIMQFETGGAMGSGVLLRDQPGVINSWSVSQEWLSKNVRSHSGASNLTIVTGFGDSMRPKFNPGDPLLVDCGVRSVEFDAIYFFRVEKEGFIKRLQRIPGEGIRVISDNKDYESWTIKAGMDFEVFGRVLKIWKGEDF